MFYVIVFPASAKRQQACQANYQLMQQYLNQSGSLNLIQR